MFGSTKTTFEQLNDHELIPQKHRAMNGFQEYLNKRRSFRRSKSACASGGRTPDIARRIIESFNKRPISHRERAVIQLDSLLNETKDALPAFVRVEVEQNTDETTSIQNLSKALNTQPYIMERLVKVLFPSSSSDVNIQHLDKIQVQKLARILNSTVDVRALVFFKVIDEDEDQYVSAIELRRFYEKYLATLTTFDHERIDTLVRAMLQKFGLDKKSNIGFEEFFVAVSNDSTLFETLSRFTVDPRSFQQSKTTDFRPNKTYEFFQNLCFQNNDPSNKSKFKHYFQENLARSIFFIIYCFINVALLVYVVVYRLSVTTTNVPFVIVARVNGMLLNFNCALVIVVMLKKSILIIRSISFLRNIIPVDDHIDFHKMIGRFIALLSILHTAGHFMNFAHLSNLSFVQCLFTTKVRLGLVPGAASITGIILCVILLTMVVCSMQWIRRGGHFQIFYWTHLLYIPFFIALILHAPNCWKWLIGPLTLLFLEKLYSIIARYSSNSGRSYLHSATIEQSNVISLIIHRPKNFHFKAGDYIGINLPSVAVYEYHPFTISSAPEELNYLRVHILACGNWTKRVYQRFKEMSEESQEERHVKVHRADLHPITFNRTIDCETTITNDANEAHPNTSSITLTNNLDKKKLREQIFIKGPYSSCARYVFDCKHVVLIGGGIGITPYASILSSLMTHFRSSRVICRHCNGINYQCDGALTHRRLKRVDFIWVNRDYKNFEWFLNLLRQFEDEQESYLSSNPEEKRFLDIHLYFTAIKNEQNIGNAPLDLVTKVWEQVAGQDIFTNLKSRTRLGRPIWNEIFDEIVADDNSATTDDVNVFFCGPRNMSKAIQNECVSRRFHYYEEKF